MTMKTLETVLGLNSMCQLINVFGADPIGVSIGVRFFVSMHYLLNQLMDFDQTCIDTLLGGEEELI